MLTDVLISDPAHHWYLFYRWFKSDNWSALGSIVSGIAATISSISVLLIWRQNKFASIQADAAKETVQSLLEDRTFRKHLNYQIALHLFLKTQHTLMTVAKRITHNTLGKGAVDLVFPPEWPQASIDIARTVPSISEQQIVDLQNYGIHMSQLDQYIKLYRDAPEGIEKVAALQVVSEALHSLVELSAVVRKSIL